MESRIEVSTEIIMLVLIFLAVNESTIVLTDWTRRIRANSNLHLASHITHASTQKNPGGFICETWIFPVRESLIGKPDGDDLSRAYNELPFSFIRPIVLPNLSDNEHQTTNFSYSIEFEESDIVRASILGVRQLTSNCIMLMIDVDERSAEIVMALIATKYGRPHKDFFVFVGSLSLTQNLFHTNKQIQDIRYKYVVEEQPEEEPVQNTSKLFHIWNTCALPGESLPPFDRKCDTHIRSHHFRAVASSIEPFVHFGSQKTSKEGSSGGILRSLFQETSSRMNFTFELRYSGFLGSSGFKKDGVWYGAVGEVFKGEADVAFGVATTVHRFPINDPGVTQVWITRYFYIRTPSYRTSWGSIFWPLTGEVWLLTGCLFLFVIIPVYYACAHVYCREYSQTRIQPVGITLQLLDALWRIFMEQSGAAGKWKFTRIRLMLFLWAYFCLVLMTGYRSKLINFLTFLEQAEVPQTHNDLSLSSYKLYFRWMGGVAYRHTANSPDPMHKRIMKRAVMVNTSLDGLFKALFEDNSAWLDYRINAEFAMNRYATLNPNVKVNPLFVRSQDSDYTCHIVWSFRKGSPWIESFDRMLLNILAAGLYDYYKNEDGYNTRVQGAQWLKNLNDSRIRLQIEKIMETLSVGPKPLNTGALLGLFLILFIGAIVGLGIGAVEMIVCATKSYMECRRLVKATKSKLLTYELATLHST